MQYNIKQPTHLILALLSMSMVSCPMLRASSGMPSAVVAAVFTVVFVVVFTIPWN